MRNLAKNGSSQVNRRFAFRGLFKRDRVVEERGVTGPFLLELFARNLAQTKRRIGDANECFGDIVKHHPVIAFPMHNGWQRHDADRLRNETFSARAARPSSVAARQSAFRLVPSVAV